MELIEKVSDKLRQEIIGFLYKNELMNVLTIHFFENRIEELGELYISFNDAKIDALLHIKDDGNSHFSTFFALNKEGLDKISDQIKDISYSDLLVAGPISNIKYIMKKIRNKSIMNPFSYYKYNHQLSSISIDSSIKMRKAESDDVVIVGDYLIKFFEANTQEAKDKIKSKIDISKIRLFENDDNIVGFGSFFGYSKHYIDISSVYIDKEHRNKGYGKQLLKLMIREAGENGKIAVLQADMSNDAANNIYRSVGFEKVNEYTFKFVNT